MHTIDYYEMDKDILDGQRCVRIFLYDLETNSVETEITAIIPYSYIMEMSGKIVGSKKSPAKARSSRLNGLKGGRPKGSKNKPKTPAKIPLKGEEKQSKQENPFPYILAGGGKRKKNKSGGVQNETYPGMV